MESSNVPDRSHEEIIAGLDQKAMRLSGLLREIDNHPLRLEGHLGERLDEILEVLSCRISATRALLRSPEAARSPEVPQESASARAN